VDIEDVFDNWLDGTVHRGKQVDTLGVHVTVASIQKTHARGMLDFGGSEYKEAAAHPLAIDEHRPNDKYGWWRLEEGVYVVVFNESVREGAPPLLLTSSQRLLSCGAGIAACVCGSGPLRSVLTVPAAGVNVKENARIGLLRPLG
jgi:hypothetical protein